MVSSSQLTSLLNQFKRGDISLEDVWAQVDRPTPQLSLAEEEEGDMLLENWLTTACGCD